MNAILASLSHDRKHTIESIINHYEAHQSVIVNFLYFANAMKYRLLEYARNDREHAYRQSLVSGDFLLPDGIALQLYRRAADGTRVDNMNGTDMTPDLLHVLCDRGSVSLYIYSVYDPTIGKNQSRLDRGLSELMLQFPQVRIAASYQSIYSDRGIDFPHDKRESMVARDDADYKVFLHGTGSPFQEIWSYAQREWLIQQGFMTLNVGGFLDYYSGFERRAPAWAIRAKVLETPWRIIMQPRKNFVKLVAMFGILRLWRKTICLYIPFCSKK